MDISSAVDLAIANIRSEGDTDIFPVPFEIRLLDDPDFRTRVQEHCVTRLKLRHFNELNVEPLQHVLVPKSSHPYDYRRASILSPMCSIKYLALAIMAAPTIEAGRIPIGDAVVFSHRYAPHDGKLFSEDAGYNRWKTEIVRRRELPECNLVVKCDITSFYDRINIHRLNSTLDSIGVDSWLHRMIDDVLLFWSKRDSYGIPVGSNASRILAEAALIDIDNYLAQEGVSFVRFVDDYRLFAPNLVTAQKWLGMITSRFARDNLMLNHYKTFLYPAAQAQYEEDPEPPTAQQILEEFRVRGTKYRTVPRRFTRPTDAKFAAFKLVDIDAKLQEVLRSVIAKFPDIEEVLIAVLAQERYEVLAQIDELIKRCIYSVDYVVDMLEKNASIIPATIRSGVARTLDDLLRSRFFDTLVWYEVKLLCLLSSEFFYSKDALLSYLRSAAAHQCSFGRLIALERLFGKADRANTLTLRESYDRSDDWERRRLIRLVSDALPEEEKKAWFRATRSSIGSERMTALVFEHYKP